MTERKSSPALKTCPCFDRKSVWSSRATIYFHTRIFLTILRLRRSRCRSVRKKTRERRRSSFSGAWDSGKSDPEIMLFDEVTAALDPEMVREVLDVMLELAQGGMTMLIVTHEMGFARAVADRIVFLDEGRILENLPAEEFFENPRTQRAKDFLQTFEFKKTSSDERKDQLP